MFGDRFVQEIEEASQSHREETTSLSLKEKRRLGVRQTRIVAEIEKLSPNQRQTILDRLNQPLIDEQGRSLKLEFADLLGYESEAAGLLAKTAQEGHLLAGQEPQDFLRDQLKALNEPKRQPETSPPPASEMIIES